MSQLSDLMIEYWQNSGILDDYEFQWGVWTEEFAEPNKRYFIIQESGGGETDLTLRQPNYTLYLIGKERDPFMGRSYAVGEVADAMMKYLYNTPRYECFILIKEVSQPIGPGITTGNRPWYQINIRTITGGNS